MPLIARNDPAAAERVLDAVEATFGVIADQPECGVRYPTRNPLLQDVRMLPVNEFPTYLVFYRLEDEVVRVLYVIHGVRDLPRLFRREWRA